MPVDVGRALIAHVSEVQRCGSPWACPMCAPVVRERRAEEIDRGLSAHLAGGGGAVFVTLTVRHHQADRLGPRLELVSQALQSCLSGAPWKRRAETLAYVGCMRAVEVTWSEVNGWHPHVHAVLLLERPIGAAQAADLGTWLLGRWGGVCERRGFGTLSAQHGVDVRLVSTAPDLAGYLTKIEGGWGPGQELARGDVKGGRGKGLVPAQLLAEFVETGESRFRALWLEYEAATKGKRAIVWSAGLRRRLLGEEAEEADEALAASEGADVALVRALVDGERWWEAVRAGSVGDLLTDIENVVAVFLFMKLFTGGGHAEVSKAASVQGSTVGGPDPERPQGRRVRPAPGRGRPPARTAGGHRRRGRHGGDALFVPDLR